MCSLVYLIQTNDTPQMVAWLFILLDRIHEMTTRIKGISNQMLALPNAQETGHCKLWNATYCKGINLRCSRFATQVFEGWVVNVNQSGAKINVRITFQTSDYFTTLIAGTDQTLSARFIPTLSYLA